MAQTFTKKVLITLGLVLFAVILVAGILFLLDVILLLFAAILLAIFIRRLANILKGYTGFSDTISALAVLVLLIALTAGAVFLLAPNVTEQIRLLRVELPRSAQSATEYISRFDWGSALIDQLPSTDEVLKMIDVPTMLSRVGGYFSATVGALGNFVLVVLVAVYFACEPKFYVSGLIKLFPPSTRPRAREILIAMEDTLAWWLIGKIISMIFIGLLTWIGLSILGVPLALTLGLLAGLLSFVPNFGPIISAIPAILLAFIDRPSKAVYVLILFVVVQIVESNLVTPFIERRTVELPPALTVLAQVALGILIGGLGIVLATPLLALVVVAVQMIYIQDVLGDKEVKACEKEAAEPKNASPT